MRILANCYAEDPSAPPPAHGSGEREAQRAGVAAYLADGDADPGRGKDLTDVQQESGGSVSRRRCADCGASRSTIWRKGPAGLKTLCNKCGIRHSKLVKLSAHLEEDPEDVAAAVTLMIMSKDISGSSTRLSQIPPSLDLPQSSSS